MLKTRLIPCLLLKNGLLVRSEEFRLHQVIGNPVHQVERFNAWAVDELIYIDITREGAHDLRRDDHKVKASGDLLEIIEGSRASCFMPLTFGGGIRTSRTSRARLAHGADKVTINTQAVEEPGVHRRGGAARSAARRSSSRSTRARATAAGRS